MVNPSADRPAHRRGRAVAATVSAPGRCHAGRRAGGRRCCGSAHPREYHPPGLEHAEHITQDRSRRAELQYFTAHNRHRLISQYGKRGKVDYRSWQKDVLGGQERAVDQVVILPDEKTWSKQTRMIVPLPAASFGIRSTGAQVARAIRDGAAHPDGLGTKDADQPKVPAGFKVTHS